MEKRVISTRNYVKKISRTETSLRPNVCWSEYIGQEKVKGNLKVYIEAAKARGRNRLDHVLFVRAARTGKDDTCRDYCQ